MLRKFARNRCRNLSVAFVLACGIASAPLAASAQDAPFYKGKTIRFLVGTAAGGGFSTYALLLASHLQRHIPGNPNITVEHKPGAGGIVSLNFIATAGAKDGTAMAIVMPNFYVTPFVDPKSVRFDPREFRFIGRMSDFGRVLVAWHETGARSIEDLKSKQVIVGASSRRSTTYVGPALLNDFLDTKMKIVTGYRGTGPTLIALEKGEVGATTVAWSTLVSLRPQWLKDGKIRVLGGMDSIPVPMKGVPSLRDLIKDPKQKAVFDFIHLAATFGTAVAFPPGVPADRVKELRAAFDATVRDPKFLEEARKRNMPINPMSGAALDKLFADSGIPTDETAAYAAKVMGISK